MSRPIAHADQLDGMYAADDGRLEGTGIWKKLPLFWFVLFLSYRCTRRCRYCYSFNQLGQGGEADAEMDENTFSRLLDWIPEVWRANNIKVNTVVFLGGEPLLWTGRIRRVMEAVFRSTNGMQSILFTNGDLIDSVCWEDLEDIQWIATNVTDISLEELSRRMRIIDQRSNVAGQTIVATLDDENLERILDVTRFGIENGHRLRYYRNLYQGLDAGYRKRLLKKYHDLCDMIEEYVAEGHDVQTTFLFDTLIPSWDLESSPYPCGRRLAAVFPDGAVGPCIRNHTAKTTTIFDEDPINGIQCEAFRYDLENPDLPGECAECESRTACQGGCPHDRVMLTGASSGKSVVCDIHKEIIPRLRYLHRLKRDRVFYKKNACS